MVISMVINIINLTMENKNILFILKILIIYSTDHMFRLMSDFVVKGDVTYQIKLKLYPEEGEDD